MRRYSVQLPLPISGKSTAIAEKAAAEVSNKMTPLILKSAASPAEKIHTPKPETSSNCKQEASYDTI